MDELTDWYVKNKDSWISFMMNTGFSKEDAEDVLSDVYLYCLQDMDLFSVPYITQMVLFRIKNRVRDRKVYEKYLKEYSEMLYALQGGGDSESREDMMDIIKEEIEGLNNSTARDVLTKHFFEHATLNTIDGCSHDYARKIVSRFKKKMVDKYGMHL